MSEQTSGSWVSRLGWAFDLIADDPEVRARAHERLAAAAKTRSEALAAYNRLWEPGDWTPARTAAHERYVAARRNVLPDALWDVPAADLPAWPGLPYALLYLEWEVLFPDEWMAHGKGWGTKQGEIRNLTVRCVRPADVRSAQAGRPPRPPGAAGTSHLGRRICTSG